VDVYLVQTSGTQLHDLGLEGAGVRIVYTSDGTTTGTASPFVQVPGTGGAPGVVPNLDTGGTGMGFDNFVDRTANAQSAGFEVVTFSNPPSYPSATDLALYPNGNAELLGRFRLTSLSSAMWSQNIVAM